MIKNYIKIALRNLRKQKLHSVINIAGLTVGMAVSILILSYVWFERSFDRFHSNSDQIYRVVQTVKSTESESHYDCTGLGLALALKEECPEILQTARMGYLEYADISYKETKINLMRGKGAVCADNDIFKIFDIDLIHGDPETALLDPNSIIITEEESRKIFGNENPIDKFIDIHFVQYDEVGVEDLVLKVTGVAKAMPDNSHFEFKYLFPIDITPRRTKKFLGLVACTYLTLPVDYPPENLEAKFPEFVKKNFSGGIERRYKMTYDEMLESGGYWKLRLQALKHIHLH